MANMVLQGARAAVPYLVNTASQAALAYANQGISNFLNTSVSQGPRLGNLLLQTSREGAPMPRIFGRYRLAGQVIWATTLKETSTESSANTGGKGGGPKVLNYSYSISFAVGLCEGEILGIGLIWANGEILSGNQITYRVHKGGEDQAADPLIDMVDGPNTPAYRGAAYIVFEDFPLDDFGGRLPQINVEVFRRPKPADDRPRLESLVAGVNLIPGSGEFVYADNVQEEQNGFAQTRAINMNNLLGKADVVLAIDQLEDQLPNCKSVSIVISWFGDDLRCGQCKIRPGVESRERIMKGERWRVNGLDRDSALQITRSDDAPIYGGTPSDASVIALIKMLKSRGFSVSLYPFILMDIEASKGQPSLPWRGRISADGNDQTSSAASQVDSFFGNCGPSDFGSSGNDVTYTGPDENSFRRMILHYAKLAQMAGGVDSFIIGSEMRGLTTVRGLSHSYPAVAQLQSLARDVRALVGRGTKLTYAADWSEYFGHHKDGDVHFHLDPLWAHDDIDAVGIDAYFPLADWREGDDHLDAQSFDDTYDADYLTANVEGGEGYDWYYSNDDARAAQTRTPITDGLAGKPWVYRYKDLRNWWSEPHYNRENGRELSAPTQWSPQSKPIWLTEVGCPAVDKGANQPNVFLDPNSSESAAPYFSDGARNDLIQRRYLEALLSYWGEPSGNNPVSNVYAGPMIDLSGVHAWCWDARPFPDFPARESVWSDGPNWARGHWLSGRVGSALLSDIVTELTVASGAQAPNVSGLSGTVTGYMIDRPMSARSAIEPLALVHGFDVVEGPSGLSFKLRSGQSLKNLSSVDLASTDSSRALTHVIEDPEGRIRDARLHFIDAASDYLLGMVSVQNDAAMTVNIVDIDAPMVLEQATANLVCSRIFERAQIGLESAQFTLAPNALDIAAGDVVSLPDFEGVWVVETLQGESARQSTARRIDEAGIISLEPAVPIVTGTPFWPSPAQVIILDIPTLTQERSGPLIGVTARPWNRVTLSCEQSVDTPVIDITAPAYIGVLLTGLHASYTGRRDFQTRARIRLAGPALSSIQDAQLLAGGNAMALKTSTGWEVLQVQTAVLIGVDEYEVSGFLRGQSGTQSHMDEVTQAGAQIVWLGSGLKALSLPNALRGDQVSVTAYMPGRSDSETQSFVYTAQHLRPLAPVHIRVTPEGEGVMISWTRQTRYGGDDWASLDVPLSQEREHYGIEFLDGQSVVMTRETNASNYVLSAQQLAANPALDARALKVRVYQISASVGRGAALTNFLTS